MNKFTKTIAGIVAAVAFVAVASTAGAATFTRSLTVGSTGADVTALQTWLNANGYLTVAPTGYFGTMTQAAVAKFQAANGITPAAGYFGPITQAKWEAVAAGSTGSTGSTVPGCTAGAMYSSTTGAPCTGSSTGSSSLSGTDGSISDVTVLSQYSDEEVGEGDEDVKVYGFEVEASNDGDIALRSVKVEFDPAANDSGDSSHLDDYISGVKVWMGDKEIGSADVDAFNEESDDTYTKTITLKSGTVVKSDDTEKFYITVDGANSFDSSDIDTDAWTVDILNIRYEDGSGVVTTDDATGDIDDAGVQMDFVSFADSADTEIKFSTDSSSPEADVVMVDESDTTDDVVLVKGKIKIEGTSDITLDELPVTLTATGSGVELRDITGAIKLSIDGEEYTENVTSTATSATITFDRLDLVLDAGKTYSFTVSADIEGTDGDLDEGDTLTASVSSTNRDYVDAEDEEGDQVADNKKTGTVTGEAQEFRLDGIMVSLVSTDTDVTTGQSSNDDLGTFKIKFKVKASGDTVYVASLAGTSGGAYNLFEVQKSGTATTGNTISGTITNTTDDDLTSSVGNYEIEEGQEETFELVVTAQLGAGGTAGQYRALLTGIKWNTDDSTTYTTYSSNLDSFKTSYVGLN
jgi:hypothetical protein